MTAVNNFYAEQTTPQTNTSSTYSDALTIAAASLAASTKYLIIAKAILHGDSTGGNYGIRVETADDATIATRSEMIIEPNATGVNDGIAYLFVHSFSTDGTPADLNIQIAAITSTSTATADQQSLLLIDLTDLGASNYVEGIHADPGASTTELGVGAGSATTIVELADTLGTTDEWLTLGYARTQMGSTGRSFGTQLQIADDASSLAVANFHFAEGEDTAELRVVGVAARHKAITGSTQPILQSFEEHAAANMFDRGGYLIALNGAAFADFQHDYTAAATSVTTSGAVVAAATFTPTAGDYLVVGRADGDDDDNKLVAVRNDTPTYLLSGDEAVFQTQGWDPTDEEYMVSMVRENLSAVSDTWQTWGDAAATVDFSRRWLLMLSLETAGGATNELVATAAGTSTVTGTLKLVVLPSATAAGLSAVTASLDAIIKLAATPAGVSTTTGTLKLLVEAEATAAGTSSVSAVLKQLIEAEATAAGTSTVTGTLKQIIEAEATSAGVSTVAATLTNKAFHQLAATSTGVSVVTAALKLLIEAEATSAGVSTATAALKLLIEAEATAAGLSTVTATLTNKAFNQLVATSTGVSAVTAALKQLIEAEATANGVSSATATLKLLIEAEASAASVSTVTATLTNKALNPLVATAAGVSTVTAALKLLIEAEATSAGVSTVIGSLDAGAQLSATSAGISTVTAALTNAATNDLAATSAGLSTLAAALKLLIEAEATSAGASTVTATLTNAAAGVTLEATVSGASALTATLDSVAELSASAAGLSSLTADLKVLKALSVTMPGVSQMAAVLTVPYVPGFATLGESVTGVTLAEAVTGAALDEAASSVTIAER